MPPLPQGEGQGEGGEYDYPSTPLSPMRFEKLEILGFKSFADKTSVHLLPGMTAIVGPNGCGKSNISDALRWVLGEQNAKQIRGEKMEDVIFAGAARRKATGMAEVSLTVSGAEGKISSEFGQFDEITITRRLYRSGESEYLINKVHCRLRDIRDIFLDTGVGARAFSIMEQGKIDQILSREAEDRRFIVEEIAGIMKYKARRAEALSRLESTGQNLLRVRDIIAEVKRQLGSLDRQARKAEKYHQLEHQIKHAELVIARHNYTLLSSEWREKTAEAERRRMEEAALEANVASADARIEETRLALVTAEQEVAAAQQAVHGVEKDVQRLEGEITLCKSQIASCIERRDLSDAESSRLANDMQTTALILEQQRKEGAETEASLAGEQAELLEKNTALLARSKELRQREGSVEEDKAGLFQLVQRISDARNRIASWEAKEQNLLHREERREAELKETAREMASSEEALSVKLEEDQRVKKRLENLKAEQGRIDSDIRETRDELRQCRQHLTECRDTATRLAARLHSLQEMEQKLEGYQDGVKAVLNPAKAGAVEGIHSVVAALLTTSPDYEPAIEAALGDRLQHVVVEDHDRGRAAVEYLKSINSGRATFIPMRPYDGRTQGFAPASLSGDSRVIGPALELVECREGYRAVVEHLLGDVLIVRDLAAAFDLWDGGGQSESSRIIVTLDGEVFHPSGSITGGSADKLKSGLLTKKREIRELEESVKKAEAEHAIAVRREQELVKKNSELAGRGEGLVKALHGAQIEEVHCGKDISALKAEIARLIRKRELLEFERGDARKERNELSGKMGEVQAAIDGLVETKGAIEEAIGLQQEELTRLRDEVEDMREEVTRITVVVTSLTGRKDAAAKAVERLMASLAGMEHRKASLGEEVRETLAKRQTAEEGLKEAEEGLARLLDDLDKGKGSLTLRREALSGHTDRLKGLEEERKAATKTLDTAREAHRAAEMRIAELRLRMDHLREGISNRYEIDLEIPVAGDDAGSADIEETRAILDDLKKKMGELGPVNLAAIEEYRELKERFDFLTKQEADLNESIESLRTAIQKINGTTETLFLDAFNAINEWFKKMFAILFQGGAAHLLLSDPENLLETGVDIIVQLPGKKVQHISLMSGGEKSLTAIALLFACFHVKPSPFCLMDEVDAALDETNVRRFAGALREMTGQSQFVVISHNKATMEQADALYGVTMEEPGVSRLLSVSLAEPVVA